MIYEPERPPVCKRSESDDLNEYNNMDTLSERVSNDNMPLNTRPAVDDVKGVLGGARRDVRSPI
jgi:hypothetical protein